MRTYGETQCSKCGEKVAMTSPTMQMCRPCADWHRFGARQAKGRLKAYGAKDCGLCGKSFEPNSSFQRFCSEECRTEGYRQKTAEYRRAKRDQSGVIAIGTHLPCTDCGKTIQFRGGTHRRCDRCQRDYEHKRNAEWLARNPDKRARYRRTSKDRSDFDDNRSKALERDGFKCTECRTPDDLQMHHIDGKGATRVRKTNATTILRT